MAIGTIRRRVKSEAPIRDLETYESLTNLPSLIGNDNNLNDDLAGTATPQPEETFNFPRTPSNP